MSGNARRRAQRQLDIAGAIPAAIGIIGVIVKPTLIPLWAFLILFGVTTVPERLIRWARLRRRNQRNS